MIRFVCPSCRQKHQAPDHAAGKKTRCPSCNSPFRVPVPVAAAVAPSPVEPAGPSVADITRGVWNTINLLIALVVLAILIGLGVYIYSNWDFFAAKADALRNNEPKKIEIQFKSPEFQGEKQ